MDWEIREIGGFMLNLLGSVSLVAALIGLLALLNRRDRRQDRLLLLIARQFSGEALRSDIVIDDPLWPAVGAGRGPGGHFP